MKFDSVLLSIRSNAVSGLRYQGNAYKTICFLKIQGFPAGPAGVPGTVDSQSSGGSAVPERPRLEWGIAGMNENYIMKQNDHKNM